MSIYFAEKTWEELTVAIERNTLILFPIGTVEEHGMHLPVNTDAIIAQEVTRLIAERILRDIPILVLPTVWSGYSAKEMMRWPGTIRISTRTFMDMIFGVCSSLIAMGFKKIILINNHGHHTELLGVVVREIADAYDVHMALTDVAKMGAESMKKVRKSELGGCLHGCEWETAMMLALNQRVIMDKVTKEDTMKYHSKFYPGDAFAANKLVFWSTWGIQKSKTGIYGDPTVATKETGLVVLEAIINNYLEFIKEFYRKN